MNLIPLDPNQVGNLLGDEVIAPAVPEEPVVAPPVAADESGADPDPEPAAPEEAAEEVAQEEESSTEPAEETASGGSNNNIDARLLAQGQNRLFGVGFSSVGITGETVNSIQSITLDNGQTVQVTLTQNTDLPEATLTAATIDAQVFTYEYLRELSSPLGEVESFISGGGFVDGIDRLREEVKEEARLQSLVVGSGFAISGGLSVGYVIWAARSGILLSSMLSTLPAWRFIDPFPVLSSNDLLAGDDDDDESLVSIASNNEDVATDTATETETESDAAEETADV